METAISTTGARPRTEVDPQATADTSVICFPEGIIGVPGAQRFQLLEREESVVRVLRCLDINGFALPVVEPRLAAPDYTPSIAPRLARALGLDGSATALVLAVATLEQEGTTANLRAPLVINVDRRVGAQVILDDRNLPLRAPLRQQEAICIE